MGNFWLSPVPVLVPGKTVPGKALAGPIGLLDIGQKKCTVAWLLTVHLIIGIAPGY